MDPKTPDPGRNKDLLKQFKELYGDKPTSIKIMFPPAPRELFFAQWYKRYGKSTLVKCKGDGEIATTSPEFSEGLEKIGEDERGFIQVKCLGPECIYQAKKKECQRMAALQVILPEIKGLGVWQINTGSYNSIVNMNSAIDWLTGLTGRYAMIPVTLMRQEQDIQYEGKRSKHYILQIDTQDVSIGMLQKFALDKAIEKSLIPAADESKDTLFYDKNGKKPPQIEAPAENAEIIPEKPEKPPTEAKSKGKGPISEGFERNQKSKELKKQYWAAIKVMNHWADCYTYVMDMNNEKKFDLLTKEDRDELRKQVSAHLAKLKEKEGAE
jgi:hypothetical protein